MRVFLAGIMQGSMVANGVHGQHYRSQLAELLQSHVSDVEVFDPWKAYPNSLQFDDARVRSVLVANVEEAARADLVIAFLPEASMGTALEVWEAWRAGVPVIVISPLAANWVVRTCAAFRFDTLDEFAAALRAGQLAALAQLNSAPVR